MRQSIEQLHRMSGILYELQNINKPCPFGFFFFKDFPSPNFTDQIRNWFWEKQSWRGWKLLLKLSQTSNANWGSFEVHRCYLIEASTEVPENNIVGERTARARDNTVKPKRSINKWRHKKLCVKNVVCFISLDLLYNNLLRFVVSIMVLRSSLTFSR